MSLSTSKELIAALSIQLNFDQYRLRAADCTLSDTAALLAAPEEGSPCMVRRPRNRSGSAYEQQRQPGLLVGFMRSSTGGIKALVIYTEQPDESEPIGFAWGFVDLAQVVPLKKNIIAAYAAKRILETVQ